MKSCVQLSKVSGSIVAPASKSVAQRAVFASLLCHGESVLKNWTWCDDSYHAVRTAESLGAQIILEKETLRIIGGLDPKRTSIHIGESGLSSRILSSLLLLCEEEMTLEGSGSLNGRSFEPMNQVYRQLDVTTSLRDHKFLPLSLSGKLRGSKLVVDASMSSQFVTGLMLSLAFTKEASSLELLNPKSIPYIDLTCEILSKFGIEWRKHENLYSLEAGSQYISTDLNIEGDWSAIAFLIAIGINSGDIEIKNVPVNSVQADKKILTLFPEQIEQCTSKILVKKGTIQGFVFDASHCPDLFPPLVAIATKAHSKTTIKGISRLRNKESDRATVLRSEFAKLGIRIQLEGDLMHIFPGQITGGKVNAHNDHRIAMSLAVAGLNSKNPVEIEGSECISKSYPNFFHDLQHLGADVTITDEHEQLWANF